MTEPTINQYGIKVTLPTGWDGIIYRRPPQAGETTHPVLHTASFPLPTLRGDYGNGAVQQMKANDVLVALLEFGSTSARTALFSKPRPQVVMATDFSPNSLQHPIPGQVGMQRFFAENGRSFCLYVVLGSFTGSLVLLPAINQLIHGLGLLQVAP